MDMSLEKSKIPFPFWEYLKQPVFSYERELVLNPRRFAYLHRISYLEKCWARQYDKMGPPQN